MSDALGAIERICRASEETDLIALLERIRRHERIPMHGPEHHALVPAVSVTGYRNAGGTIGDDAITTAIARGKSIAGGYCGFMGACGAALGVGAAFAMITEASPLKAGPRQVAQMATAEALEKIAKVRAARCCQRDSYLALVSAAASSERLLDIALEASTPLKCTQQGFNSECAGKACPLME